MAQNTVPVLILCLLALHVFVVSASYNECEAEEFARCNRVFTEVFEKADDDENVLDSYCEAYKKKVRCLASKSQCVGEVIDLIRFAVLQHVTKDITLGTCTDIDLKPLRTLVQVNEKYRMKIAGLKDLDTYKFQPCAAKKNIYCASRLAEEMKNDGKLCQALPNYFKCYESKTMVCDDDIYKDFVADVKAAAPVVKEFAKKFPNVMPGCHSRYLLSRHAIYDSFKRD